MKSLKNQTFDQVVRTIDIEIQIMRRFNFRQNLIVPNVTDMSYLIPFETDMVILSQSGYATGFEIKVSKSDLKADLNKIQYKRLNDMFGGKPALEKYFGKFKYFYYAVPIEMQECTLDQIPEFCGLYAFDKKQNQFKVVRQPKKLFGHKWSERERYQLARLGAMRIFGLKHNLLLKNEHKQI